MKIIFYHSSLKKGGAERVIAGLADYFSQQGHQVSIITIDNSRPEYAINKKVWLIPLNGLKNSSDIWEAVRFNLSLAFQVKRKLKLIDADIVVCFGVNQLLHAYLASVNMKCKIVGSERANPYEDSCGLLWNKIKLYLYKNVDGFIFQTRGAEKFYQSKSRTPSCIIQNPISREFIEKEVTAISHRQPNIFYSFGRLTYAKSYDYLIKSFIKFHGRYPECKLIIYGMGMELNAAS